MGASGLPYEVWTEGFLAGGELADFLGGHGSRAEAEAAFEEASARLVDALHDAIEADARSHGCDPGYVEDYYDAFLRAVLYEGDGEAASRTVTAEDAFGRYGRTGSAWKVEVVSRDGHGEVADLLETLTAYPGGDAVALGREALARCARKAAGAATVELYVTYYMEVDDDGGDGEGAVVCHEAVEPGKGA